MIIGRTREQRESDHKRTHSAFAFPFMIGLDDGRAVWLGWVKRIWHDHSSECDCERNWAGSCDAGWYTVPVSADEAWGLPVASATKFWIAVVIVFSLVYGSMGLMYGLGPLLGFR